MNIYSLIKVNTTIFPEFIEYEEVNSDWSIEKHLNTNYCIDDAILFSRLYFPEFIEYKNCIILKERYNESIFNEWFKEFSGEISTTEKICNMYEVKDLFHINNKNVSDEKIHILGKLLLTSWQMNLSFLFPTRKLVVELFEEYNELFITFYSSLNHIKNEV